jgi:glycosyltransferase involved in cell wall biosynthesis
MAQIISLERHRRMRQSQQTHVQLAAAPSALQKLRASERREAPARAGHPALRRVEGSRDRQASLPVSVVVPTCGRPQLLEQCLAALVAQQFPPTRYEIVIVDDGPSAATRAVVEAWRARVTLNGPRIAYVANSGAHGPAAARNRGWKNARGSIIAFTDDDTIPDPQWLVHGMRAFGEDVQAVWGKIVMPLDGTPTDYERDAKGLEGAEFVTANCFCPRYVLEELGGFDERFRYAWREDADLYFRLLQRDGRIVHAPGAVVVHPIRPAGWGVSLKQQKKILFDALLYKKHPGLYREKIRAHARWDYYLIVASVLFFVLSLAQGWQGGAMGAAALWLLMTARFCHQRLASTTRTPAHIAEMLVTSALIPPVSVFWRMTGALRFRTALF